MENENTNIQPSEKPKEETDRNASYRINPIHLKYLREAWKRLKEEKGQEPTHEDLLETAAKNLLRGTRYTDRKLEETERKMEETLERAIAKKERDKRAQQDTRLSTTIPEEPPTEFWEDFPHKIPERQKKADKNEPRDWYSRWEEKTETRRDELSEKISKRGEENKRSE